MYKYNVESSKKQTNIRVREAHGGGPIIILTVRTARTMKRDLF